MSRIFRIPTWYEHFFFFRKHGKAIVAQFKTISHLLKLKKETILIHHRKASRCLFLINQPAAAARPTPTPIFADHFCARKGYQPPNPMLQIKKGLLEKLRQMNQGKYGGRLNALKYGDIQNLSIVGNEGECTVKCPLCAVEIKLPYKSLKNGGEPSWQLTNLTYHLSPNSAMPTDSSDSSTESSDESSISDSSVFLEHMEM